MLMCYFDESGGKDHGFLIVAGYVGSAHRWQQCEYDWKIALAKYHVPYLHMRLFAHSRPPYEKWKGQEGMRAVFLRSLASIIADTADCAFICYVRYEDFEKVNRHFKLNDVFNSPYALAGSLCIEQAAQWKEKCWPSRDIEYIFESGAPDQCGLDRAANKLNLAIPIFRPGQKEKGISNPAVQLQTADFLAYEIRKYVVDHPRLKTSNEMPRRSLGALASVKLSKMFLHERWLVDFCHTLGIQRRGSKGPGGGQQDGQRTK